MSKSKRIWRGILSGMLMLAVLTIIVNLSNTIKYGPQDASSDPVTVETSPALPEFVSSSDVRWGTISGFFMKEPFHNVPVQYTMVDGYPIYQGDIILRLDEDDPARSGLGIPRKMDKYYWPDGLVAYEIHERLPDQFRIHDAIAHWEEHTNIRFVERNAANADQYDNWIRFQPGLGCSSYVGMVGGRQPINLAKACSTGNTIHEIGHALGLWHEHSRSDRDDYVDVRYENIISSMAFNFDKHVDDGVDIGPYDYGSIMHYPAWAFSKNGKDTIVTKNGESIGQRKSLSPGDIAAIEYIYGN